ncbi:MAG: hypothetical protein HZB61_05915 [Nitrospirae bacterium]|nr:hypothetical protein [Nitrospirota bacterium]
MSVAIQCIDCPSFFVGPSSTGFSDDSRNLVTNLLNQFREICEPLTIGRHLEEAMESLIEVYTECTEANWDGYGAEPVSKDSFFEASKFINLIPSSFPMPQITAEPSGEIGLEWYKDKKLIFVISLSGKNIVTYAGIFGSNKTHGTEYFGDTIPPVLIENLRRLYP